MKIIRVDAFLMSCPMPEPVHLPFWGGLRTVLKRDAMLIRVLTDTGLKGFAPGPAHERARSEVDQLIGPFLLGKNPLDWQTFDFQAHPETQKTYRAVEIALMDLAARYEGCPLSELLGGRQRDRIKLYGSAGMYMSPEGYAEEAAAIAEMGFPAYKMRPALGPEEDLRTVERMRAATAPDFGLMIDAHSWWRMGSKSYSHAQIHELAAAMAAYQPTWLEEPFEPEDHDAYLALREAGFVPVASGEHEQALSGFEDLAARRVVDYLQMDVCCQGGFEMGAQVFRLAEAQNLRFAFHCWGSDLEVLASAHLGVCWPDTVVEWLEYPCYSSPGKAGMYPFPLASEILREPLHIEKGMLVLPDGPGLGLKINEAIIEKYPYIPGPWSFFHLDDPQETVAVTGDHSLKWIADQTN